MQGREKHADGDRVQEFVRLIEALVKECGGSTPWFELASGNGDRATDEGRGEQDIAAMFSVLGKKAGIE